MFKKKEEEPRTFVSPEMFRHVAINPNQSAVEQIGCLSNFLLQAVDGMNHKVVIETDNKSIEIIVSVETHKTTEDG